MNRNSYYLTIDLLGKFIAKYGLTKENNYGGGWSGSELALLDQISHEYAFYHSQPRDESVPEGNERKSRRKAERV